MATAKKPTPAQLEIFANLLVQRKTASRDFEWADHLRKEKGCHDMLTAPLNFPKTPGFPSGTHWASTSSPCCMAWLQLGQYPISLLHCMAPTGNGVR